LLINLLAESQGLPDALRILSLFEHQFGMLWEPVTSSVSSSRIALQAEEDKERRLHTLVVAWDDALIAEYFHK
jgi:hypothetical protein